MEKQQNETSVSSDKGLFRAGRELVRQTCGGEYLHRSSLTALSLARFISVMHAESIESSADRLPQNKYVSESVRLHQVPRQFVSVVACGGVSASRVASEPAALRLPWLRQAYWSVGKVPPSPRTKFDDGFETGARDDNDRDNSRLLRNDFCTIGLKS